MGVAVVIVIGMLLAYMAGAYTTYRTQQGESPIPKLMPLRPYSVRPAKRDEDDGEDE